MARSLPSKTQLDRLGDRLRDNTATNADLRVLDHYRRSFWPTYENIVRTVRDTIGVDGTGRPAKTTTSITEKLRRQRIRLSQIQDIAGYRIVVDSILEQDEILARLTGVFPNARVEDRRIVPSHGYRAVHLIVSENERLIELQLRTLDQHRWAQVSEKLADLIDAKIKYGGGPNEVRSVLDAYGEFLFASENLQRQVPRMRKVVTEARELLRRIPHGLATQERAELEESARRIEDSLYKDLANNLKERRLAAKSMLAMITKMRRAKK